jgi:predicted Zn-dependent protease
MQKALELDPNSPLVLNDAGRLSEFHGRWGEAEQRYRRGLVRAPLDPYLLHNLGWLHLKSGRIDEAEVELGSLANSHPEFYWAHGGLTQTLLRNNKPDLAISAATQIRDEAYRKRILPGVLCANGRTDEAKAILEDLVANAKRDGFGAYWIARGYSNCNMKDTALDMLELALEQRDALIVDILGDPSFEGIRQTPRFKTVLRKMNLPETPPG